MIPIFSRLLMLFTIFIICLTLSSCFRWGPTPSAVTWSSPTPGPLVAGTTSWTSQLTVAPLVPRPKPVFGHRRPIKTINPCEQCKTIKLYTQWPTNNLVVILHLINLVYVQQSLIRHNYITVVNIESESKLSINSHISHADKYVCLEYNTRCESYTFTCVSYSHIISMAKGVSNGVRVRLDPTEPLAQFPFCTSSCNLCFVFRSLRLRIRVTKLSPSPRVSAVVAPLLLPARDAG